MNLPGRLPTTPSPTRSRLIVDQAITETEWQNTVVAYATYMGYTTYHTHDSRRSNPGFPDLVLVRNSDPGDLIFWEIKPARGRLSHAQEHWIERVRAAGVTADVIRPADWSYVQKRLARYRP